MGQSTSVSAKLLRAPSALAGMAEYRSAALRGDRALARAARGDGPIIAGPWRSEIGFEVLYWIPLLRWFEEHFDVDPARVHAVSRGGADLWYRDVAGRYSDIFDHFSPQDLKRWHDEQVAASGSQKQLRLSSAEQEILTKVQGHRGDAATVLHPSAMYNLFRAFWAWERPIGSVKARTVFRPLPPVNSSPALAPLPDLPDRYVAAKIYFSSCLPDKPENREFVSRLLRQLSSRGNVVLLATGLDLDDHEDFFGETDNAIVRIDDHVSPRDNLDLQTRIISGADALVTTYGGFSYLGPFLGVPSCCFYSIENFVPGHLAVMRRANKVLRDRGLPTSFVPLHVGDLPFLDRLMALRPPVSAEA